MTTIKAVIVDDEPLARERLATLLKSESDVEVVAECQDGHEAVATIERLHPDLVFLDVQMPEVSGFDVIEAVGTDRMPLVIFVTAYDQHALRAFDVRALDYLLKPFDRARFAESLARARRRLENDEGRDIGRRLLAAVTDLRETARASDRFVVKSGGRVFFLRQDEIDWIEAAGNYARLHVGPDTHLVRETMQAIEARLDHAKFVRIHRSTILRLECMRELQPWFNGEYVVILRDNTRLRLSRGYREKLEERFGRSL